jgi:RNA polymerase sigma factor (sigma-70 family)
MASDTHLIVRYRRGDLKAGEALLQRHQGLIRKWVFVYRHHAPGYTEEDLAQCAKLGLLRAAEKFDPSKGFEFNTYAGHWIQGALRASRRTVCGSRDRGIKLVEAASIDRISPSGAAYRELIQDDNAANPEDVVVSRLFHEYAISKIESSRYREVVLARLAGATHKEIALALNITPQAVSLYWSRAIKMLKEIL